MATAIALIVHEGLSITDAAQRVGYARESLSKALQKPHVIALKAAVKRAWLESETDKAWLTLITLSSSAASEDVRFKAAKTLLEAAGELKRDGGGDSGPKSLVQIMINHPAPEGASMGQRSPGVIEIIRTPGRDADRYGVIGLDNM